MTAAVSVVTVTHERAALDWLRREGVITAGSAVFRDRAMLGNGRPGTVDTSEWLVQRAVCLQVPWPEAIRRDQELGGIGEDGLWLRHLLASKIAIACSEKPTLCYRLGGRYDDRRDGRGTS